MLHILDSLINRISPEMPRHIQRWGGSLSEWQSNVDALRQFIITRCVAIQDGMKECYNLTGPYTLTFVPLPLNGGKIKINSIIPDNYPFSGLYYGGIDVLLEPIPATNFNFDRWEAPYHTFSPSSTAINALINPATDDTVKCYFIPQENNPPSPTSPNLPYQQKFKGFYLPLAFSPNNDGINDYLFPYIGEDVASFELYIFSRWGNLVFHANSFFYWDGTYKNEKLQSGPYTYVAYVIYKDGTSEKKTGNIHIVNY